MKINILKAVFSVCCMLLLVISCVDIVEYDNNYDDGTTSYGPPVITGIATIDNSTQDLDIVDFGQMVRIKGENLSNVTSLTFNDREADLKEIYALAHEIVVAVPYAVPEEITNTITLTTEKGTTTYPVKISFPDLIVNGYSLEFGKSGEVVDILGKSFELYDLTPENGDVRINGQAATIVEVTNDRLSILVPDGVTDNSELTLSSNRIVNLLGAEPIKVPFRGILLGLLDMGPAYLTNSATSAFATDGTKEGDPSPLIVGQNYSRFNMMPGTNSNNLVVRHSYFNISPDLLAEMKQNPTEYEFKYEVFVKESLPISNTRAQIGLWVGQRPSDYNAKEWKPAESGVAFHTNDQWQTRSVGIKTFMSPNNTEVMLQEKNNLFILAYVNVGLGVQADVSFTNFRFAKRINIIRKQL